MNALRYLCVCAIASALIATVKSCEPACPARNIAGTVSQTNYLPHQTSANGR
jgi:hypothetical protein